jgi:hypothetical protein
MRVFRFHWDSFSKCTSPIPSCNPGPDHICSDGKCYSQSGCPISTFLVSNNTCTCSSACNGIFSSLQVNLNLKLQNFQGQVEV